MILAITNIQLCTYKLRDPVVISNNASSQRYITFLSRFHDSWPANRRDGVQSL